MQKNTIRTLPVKLTQEELVAKAQENARQIQKCVALEDAKKEAMAAFNADLKVLDAEIVDASRVISSGEENREVDCDERFNLDAKTVEVWRLDTGELALTRGMTRDEVDEARQGKLFPVPSAGVGG